MSRDVHELLRSTVDEPTRPLDTAAVVGKAKRQTRLARTGMGLGAVVVLALVAVVGLPLATGSDHPLEIADRPDQTEEATVLTERAPEAGSDASHWPIEFVYRQYHRDYSLVFFGTSWSDWTLEAHGDDGGIRVADREQNGQMMLDPDSGEMIEDSRGNFPRGAGPALHAGWRDAVGLIERVVVPLDQIPGGVDLVRSLGLDANEVEAYVTPNIVGCTDPLDRCTNDEEGVARAIAHLATGFPLFAEEGYGPEPTGVWLIAESFAYGDAVTESEPVPRAGDDMDVPTVADQLEDHDVHPDGWVTLQAGDLALSVPPDWTVRTVEPTRDPASQAGPCASDLYGGIGGFDSELTAPLAVVYPMETTGICPAIGLPDHPPEQPSIVLSAGIAPGRDDDSIRPPGASDERFGTVRMSRLESEPHEHFVAFERRDGQGGLFVSHLDDPLVREVLATLRTTDVVADE